MSDEEPLSTDPDIAFQQLQIRNLHAFQSIDANAASRYDAAPGQQWEPVVHEFHPGKPLAASQPPISSGELVALWDEVRRLRRELEMLADTVRVLSR
jgi:hypothetical protein